MFLKTMAILALSISSLTGCSAVDKARSDTMFAKQNEDGERCIYEPNEYSEHRVYSEYSWVCPKTIAEKANEAAYNQKKKEAQLKLPVENFRIKSLLSTKSYKAYRDKEPLKTYVEQAKKDGSITFAELNTINQILSDFDKKPTKPTQEELEAIEHKILVSKL